MIDLLTFHKSAKTGDVTVHARQSILEKLASILIDEHNVYVSEDCIIVADPEDTIPCKDELDLVLLSAYCY